MPFVKQLLFCVLSTFANLFRETSKLFLELGKIAGEKKKLYLITFHPLGSAANRSINESHVYKPLLYVIQRIRTAQFTSRMRFTETLCPMRSKHLNELFNLPSQARVRVPNSDLGSPRALIHQGLSLTCLAWRWGPGRGAGSVTGCPAPALGDNLVRFGPCGSGVISETRDTHLKQCFSLSASLP